MRGTVDQIHKRERDTHTHTQRVCADTFSKCAYSKYHELPWLRWRAYLQNDYSLYQRHIHLTFVWLGKCPPRWRRRSSCASAARKRKERKQNRAKKGKVSTIVRIVVKVRAFLLSGKTARVTGWGSETLCTHAVTPVTPFQIR